HDELSAIGCAVETFKRNAVEKARLEAETEEGRRRAEAERSARETEKAEQAHELQVAIDALGLGLSNLSSGNLIFRIETPFETGIDKLRRDFNSSVEILQQTMLRIAGSTEDIRAGTNNISSATDDISGRTQQQAATLEKTATSVAGITAMVRGTADGADRARKVASSAKLDAERSGEVMRQAIAAMKGIEMSSRQIG